MCPGSTAAELGLHLGKSEPETYSLKQGDPSPLVCSFLAVKANISAVTATHFLFVLSYKQFTDTTKISYISSSLIHLSK